MPELDPQIGADVTARLVEQLTKTNERLERLEATLRERSVLEGLQQKLDLGDSRESSTEGAASKIGEDPASPPPADDHSAQEAEEHFRRGVAFCQAGNYPDALAAWRDVLQLQPDNPYALANTGIVYTEQGRWTEAKEVFQKVLAVQPDNAEAHYGVGMAEAQMGNYSEAIAAWENTIRLQPGNTDAHFNMTLVRQRMGEQSKPAAVEQTQTTPAADGETVQIPTPPISEMPDDIASEAAAPSEAAAGDAPPVEDDEPASERGASSVTSARDWKRLENRDGGSVQTTPLKRGAGRLTRPAGSRTSRRPLALWAAAGLILLGAAIFGGYKVSKAHTAMSVNKSKANITAPAASAPPLISLPAVNPERVTPAARKVVPIDPVTSPEPTVTTPLHPGKMQIRLGGDLRGRYRYWFVSGPDRAVRMRALPRANRAGIIALLIPAEHNQPGAELRVLDIVMGKVARIPIVDISRPSVYSLPNVGPNLLTNGDFSHGAEGWSMEITAPARGTMRIEDGLAAAPGVTGRAVHFEIAAIGKQASNVRCFQTGVTLKDKEPYLLSFWAKSDKSRPLHIDIEQEKAESHPAGPEQSITLGPKWQKYMLPFTASLTDGGHGRLSLILGDAVGPIDISGLSVRHSEGADKSSPLGPDTALSIEASDFN